MKKIINIGTLVIPIIIGLIYIYILADDRFLSESKFTIKSDSESAAQLDFSMLGASSSGKQDQLIMRDHILSHDMMNKVINKFGFKSLSSSSKDFLWHLEDNDNNVSTFKQYEKLINIKYDDEGAISTLQVQAFDPKIANAINEFIISESIKFVNSFSNDLSNQYITFAENDAKKAKEKYDLALDKLKEFQDENSLLNPQGDQEILNSTLSTLETELVQAKTQLSEYESYLTDETAQVKQQKVKIKSLEEQISNTRIKMASSSGNDLNDVTRIFIEKDNNVKFTQQSYATAITTLEAARLKAMHSQKHLMVIAQATQPEKATLPKKGFNTLILIISVLSLNLLLRSGLNIVREYY